MDASLIPPGRRNIFWDAMTRPPRILLPSLPLAFRRMAGIWLLGLTLWLASLLALFH